VAGLSYYQMNPLLEIIKRPIRLFEAGDYGQKGNYTEDRLDEWSKDNTPIPFNIAHADFKSNPLLRIKDALGNALGMGDVRDFYRKGKEWWGVLHTPKVVNDLIELTGVKGISIGVPQDLSRPYEISWEGNPHITTAQVFQDDLPRNGGDTVAFTFSFDNAISTDEVDVTMTITEATTVAENTENATPVEKTETPAVEVPIVEPAPAAVAQEFSADEKAKLETELAEARAQLRFSADEKAVDALIQDGKILEAHKPALMAFSQEAHKFSADNRPFDAVIEFMKTYDPAAMVETKPGTVVPNPIEETVNTFTDPETEKALDQIAKKNGWNAEELKKNNAHLAGRAN
jgi:hypothetical protein